MGGGRGVNLLNPHETCAATTPFQCVGIWCGPTTNVHVEAPIARAWADAATLDRAWTTVKAPTQLPGAGPEGGGYAFRGEAAPIPSPIAGELVRRV